MIVKCERKFQSYERRLSGICIPPPRKRKYCEHCRRLFYDLIFSLLSCQGTHTIKVGQGGQRYLLNDLVTYIATQKYKPKNKNHKFEILSKCCASVSRISKASSLECLDAYQQQAIEVPGPKCWDTLYGLLASWSERLGKCLRLVSHVVGAAQGDERVSGPWRSSNQTIHVGVRARLTI